MDYAEIAKKFGGTVDSPGSYGQRADGTEKGNGFLGAFDESPRAKQTTDYAALAQQFGGSVEPSGQQQPASDNPAAPDYKDVISQYHAGTLDARKRAIVDELAKRGQIYLMPSHKKTGTVPLFPSHESTLTFEERQRKELIDAGVQPPKSPSNPHNIQPWEMENPNLAGAVAGGKALASEVIEGAPFLVPPLSGPGYAAAKQVTSGLGLREEPVDSSIGQIAEDTARGYGMALLGAIIPKAGGYLLGKMPEVVQGVLKAPLGKGYGEGVVDVMNKVAGERADKVLSPKISFFEKRAAGELQAAHKEAGPKAAETIEKNLAESRKLVDEITGYNPSYADAAGEDSIIGAEQSLRARNKRIAVPLRGISQAESTKAINEYLGKVVKDEGEIGDTLQALSTLKGVIEEGEKKAVTAYDNAQVTDITTREGITSNLKKTVDDLYQKLSGGKQGEAVGQNFRKGAIDKIDKQRGTFRKLFGEVDEKQVIDDPFPIVNSINSLVAERPGDLKFLHDSASTRGQQILKKLTKIEDGVVAPAEGQEIAASAKPALGPVTVGDLRAIGKDVGEAIRKATTAENYDLARRLRKIDNGIDDTYLAYKGSGAEGAEKNITALETAKRRYKEEFVPLWRGENAPGKDIIAYDTAGKYRKLDPELGYSFLKPGPKGPVIAEHYFKIYGKDPALMDSHVKNVVSTFYDETAGKWKQTQLNNWLHSHKPALRKFGLYDKYESTVKTINDTAALTKNFEKFEPKKLPEFQKLQEAQNAKSEFERSELNRMLEGDVERVIPNLVKASGGNVGNVARNLMQRLQGNPKAIAGLKKEFINYMGKEWESLAVKTSEGDFQLVAKKINEFDKNMSPMMRQIYSSDDLKKIGMAKTAALNLRRGDKMTQAGSPTASYLFDRFQQGLATAAMRAAGIPAAEMIRHSLTLGYRYNVDKVLTRAHFDLKYADFLLKAVPLVKSKIPMSVLAPKINALAINAGIDLNNSWEKEQ